jgi:hypothetical protein
MLCYPILSYGQQWSGILSPARADANWPNAGATIPSGTIPNCATQPSSNTTAAINAAFTADAGGSSYCQINIPAGTYNISGTFVLKYAGQANVVLNGAGPNQTFFVWTGPGNHSCNGLNNTNLCVYNGDSQTNAGPNQHWANSATITGGLTQGSTTLTLASTSGSLNPLTVGTLLQFAQQDAHSGTTPPYADTGNVWYCSTSGLSQPNGACSWQGGGFSPAIGGVYANLNQEVYVKSCGATTWGATCTSNNVVLSSPVKSADWSLGSGPTAWWPITKPIENVGVQNMSFDVSGVTSHIYTECHDCKNVWFSNDRFINGTVGGQAATNIMIMWQSVNLSVFNSYMYGSNPSSEGYGIDWDAGTSDSIAYNNIAHHIASSYMIETGTGNVYAYNFSTDNYFGNGWQQCDNYVHAGGSTLNLFEGNDGICIAQDNIHGTANYNTFYREFMSGFNPATYNFNVNPPVFAPISSGGQHYYAATVPVGMNSFNRYNNIVAGVFGTPGFHNTYNNIGVGGNPSSCPGYPWTVIYTLGFGNGNQVPWSPTCTSPYTFILDNDNLVTSTLMRWGNWDVVNGSVQENKAETASSAPLHPGLASPSTTFPSSFIYSSAPSWWQFPSGTAAPFPANGPDVTGGVSNLGGHHYANPANNCYHRIMGGKDDGSSGPLTFNPAACYPTTAASGAPSAPQNLTGTVVQ